MFILIFASYHFMFFFSLPPVSIFNFDTDTGLWKFMEYSVKNEWPWLRTSRQQPKPVWTPLILPEESPAEENVLSAVGLDPSPHTSGDVGYLRYFAAIGLVVFFLTFINCRIIP